MFSIEKSQNFQKVILKNINEEIINVDEEIIKVSEEIVALDDERNDMTIEKIAELNRNLGELNKWIINIKNIINKNNPPTDRSLIKTYENMLCNLEKEQEQLLTKRNYLHSQKNILDWDMDCFDNEVPAINISQHCILKM